MKLFVKLVVVVAVVSSTALVALPAAALNTVAHAPDQASCNTSWSSLGKTSPTITSLSINGEAVASPTAPTNGHVGVYICPGQGGQRASLGFYQESGGQGYLDLAGATSPLGTAVTASTPFAMTFNFGSGASDYSYTVVTGTVSSWATSNLLTSSASLTTTVSPVIAPFIDGTTNPGQCAPAPIGCNLTHSTADILSLEMDIYLVPGIDSQLFTGAHFDITGATGGAITPINDGSGPRGFEAGVAGPHFKSDGTTPASGSLSAFLPSASVGKLFSVSDPSSFDPNDLEVTRDESGTETTPSYTATVVTGGIKISLPNVSFSAPVYSVSIPGSGGSGGSGGGQSNDGGGGYRLYSADGGVFAYGQSAYLGSANKLKLGGSIVAGVSTGDGNGYWEIGSDGGVFAYGDASYYGSANTLKLGGKIVGAAATPDSKGYWLFGADGGVFAYGDAKFYGSAGSLKLAKPIVGAAASPDGAGYWLFAADGGVFSYGSSKYYGSANTLKLGGKIVGGSADPQGTGYTLFGADGGVFAYGSAGYFGSPTHIKLGGPIVGGAVTPDADGYLLVGSDGGVYAYGAAPFLGSAGAIKLAAPIVSGS